MRLSEIIRSIRPASIAEKSQAMLAAVAGGVDVTLPYPYAGWVNIADSQYTLASPRTILAGARTQITINGLGATTNRTYADGLHADVFDGNRFKPAAMGEAYQLRLTCTVTQTTSGAGHYIAFEADIGADEVPFISAERSIPLVKGQGVPTMITISDPFFCLDTFGRNGARFYVTPSVDITLWGTALFIQRTFKP